MPWISRFPFWIFFGGCAFSFGWLYLAATTSSYLFKMDLIIISFFGLLQTSFTCSKYLSISRWSLTVPDNLAGLNFDFESTLAGSKVIYCNQLKLVLSKHENLYLTKTWWSLMFYVVNIQQWYHQVCKILWQNNEYIT